MIVMIQWIEVIISLIIGIHILCMWKRLYDSHYRSREMNLYLNIYTAAADILCNTNVSNVEMKCNPIRKEC